MNWTIILTLIFFSLLKSGMAQGDIVSNADKKVAEIEAFKKFEVVRFPQADFKMLGDSVVEITMYKSKKSFAKDFEKRKNGNEIREITYYWDKDLLFAIFEIVSVNGKVTDGTKYYFASQRLFKAIGVDGSDKTNAVNRNKLRDWIRSRYADGVILD